MAQAVMTDIETIVYNYLIRHKIDFQFQTSLSGGFFELGGAVCDFLLPARGLAWRVFGEYWHQGIEKTGQDQIQREQLESLGWRVVDLWGSDLLDPTRLEQTMKLALRGEEMLR